MGYIPILIKNGMIFNLVTCEQATLPALVLPSHGDGGLVGQLLTGPKHNFYLESSKDLCAPVQNSVAGMIWVTVITLKAVSRGTLPTE